MSLLRNGFRYRLNPEHIVFAAIDVRFGHRLNHFFLLRRQSKLRERQLIPAYILDVGYSKLDCANGQSELLSHRI